MSNFSAAFAMLCTVAAMIFLLAATVGILEPTPRTSAFIPATHGRFVPHKTSAPFGAFIEVPSPVTALAEPGR
jgi:hypothetical protein